ncbi:polysaccharide pyruvyl transferase family protein [Flavobacteriaceae bacterium TK19130]|nr:polysaccharide pyruvyl transferase family protein [Thermobacterium salinum]
MSIKKVLGSVFPVIDSDRRKQYVTDKVLATPQKNDGVRNVHVVNPNNVGDYYCGPHHYFSELKGKELNISDYRVTSKVTRDQWAAEVSNNALIIGGGGLFNLRHFAKQLELFEALAEKGKKIVVWGAGHNETDRSQWQSVSSYNVDVSKFGLVGTRDYSMNNEYVPCVSCMHEIFDKSFTAEQEVGIIFNHNSIKNQELVKKLSKYPVTSNTSSLDEMVEMIGKSETIVSNSYHAIFWAILLGRKTIAIPTTSKFFDFKYQPIVATFETFEEKLSEAIAFDGVLEESRMLNRDYHEKVVNYLNL